LNWLVLLFPQEKKPPLDGVLSASREILIENSYERFFFGIHWLEERTPSNGGFRFSKRTVPIYIMKKESPVWKHEAFFLFYP